MSKKEDFKFEEGLARLEKLVEELETGELNLDRSLGLFEDGIKLARELNKKLDRAEKKLELLIKDDAGEPQIEEFRIEEDEIEEE